MPCVLTRLQYRSTVSEFYAYLEQCELECEGKTASEEVRNFDDGRRLCESGDDVTRRS